MKKILTMAGIAATLAFCAPIARAIPLSFTTNYDELNITATVATNIYTTPKSEIYVYTVHKFTFNNATLLSLLEGPDWYNGTFPAGSKLVVSWDAASNVVDGAYGDILVVDKTKTNVLYDASEESWSHSDDAYMTADFYYEDGAYNENDNYNDPGHYDFTWFNNTEFELYDDGGSSPFIDIYTYGPSTEVSVQNWNKTGAYSDWSDSEQATTYGADQDIDGYGGATVTVKISASGHGPGEGGYDYGD